MAITQDTYYIPDDIATGLATGLYRRIGSVVRYAVGPNKGRIVKHLKPINFKATEQAQGLGSKALQFVQHHKKEIGVAAFGSVVIGTSIWGYNKWRCHEPKVLTEFRTALKTYIEAIRQGNMDINIINNLMNALEVLKQHKAYEKINIQLTTEELEVLVGRIYEYTVKLAADNFVELSEDELQLNNGVIINLQAYLKAQKRIFEMVV
ncbi:hypothetical protein [Hungatella hathewayi]|uniref:hypothetical protein n=1 Tax=Hungatella hathewayi TaxID=154046 RepID=UPI003568C832